MLLQIVVGDFTGIVVHEHQPLKTAAMEGIWKTERGAPFALFAIPSQAKQENEFALNIPHVSALLNTHSWNGELQGLSTVKVQDQPLVVPVFYAFRIMVFDGFLMFFLAIFAYYLKRKNNLYSNKLFLKLSVFSAPLGFIALIAGWITAEMGRQPWVVYNLIRTSDALARVNPYDVVISMLLIAVVYGIIFGYFYTYYFDQTIRKGPPDIKHPEEKLHQPFHYMTPSSEEELK
jgi:cytochrome d ubiquinol oxidase subunit I